RLDALEAERLDGSTGILGLPRLERRELPDDRPPPLVVELGDVRTEQRDRAIRPEALERVDPGRIDALRQRQRTPRFDHREREVRDLRGVDRQVLRRDGEVLALLAVERRLGARVEL